MWLWFQVQFRLCAICWNEVSCLGCFKNLLQGHSCAALIKSFPNSTDCAALSTSNFHIIQDVMKSCSVFPFRHLRDSSNGKLSRPGGGISGQYKLSLHHSDAVTPYTPLHLAVHLSTARFIAKKQKQKTSSKFRKFKTRTCLTRHWNFGTHNA